MPNIKKHYYLEINGLRTIAVLSIVFYHAQIPFNNKFLFSGGFIGVDIFFVISGYLITSLILKELSLTGDISLTYFYEKRIRRIVPLLLFVILVSFPFAWLFLLSNTFIDFSKSIISSLSFISNYYFHFSGETYGAQSNITKPFLHTWSLSVEMQYYLLLPLLILSISKYFKNYLIYFFILLFILSIAVAEWGNKTHPSFNFYNLPTRLWEILSGSVLAYFKIKFNHNNNINRFNFVLPSIGLCLILYSIFYFKYELDHPSIYTLVPVLGTCLIIWFSNRKEVVTRILASKIFVGIGLISYSIYMWHYPILSFNRITNFFDKNFYFDALLIIIIITISIFSYYFIEKPARNKRYNFKNVFILIILFYLAVITFSLSVILKKGYSTRLPDIIGKNFYYAPFYLLKNSDGESCHEKINGCKFNTSSNQKVFIIGDSHMGSLLYDLKNKILSKNLQFISFTTGGCIFNPGLNLVKNKTKKKILDCSEEYHNKVSEILNNEKDSLIILGGRFPLYLSNQLFYNEKNSNEKENWDSKFLPGSKYNNFKDSFKTEVLKLSKNNKVILIYPMPEVEFDVPMKIYEKWLKTIGSSNKKIYNEPIATSYDVFEKRSIESFVFLDSIVNENIFRIYPHKLFCNVKIDRKCETHEEKFTYYSDSHHPSYQASIMINGLIMDIIDKIYVNH